MKKNYIVLLVAAIFFSGITIAQEAQKNFINYQGVARNGADQLMANETMTIGIALKMGSATGASAYAEKHAIVTDANGVFSLKIGNGVAVSGEYNSIPWGSEATFVTVLINGSEIGTTEMMAVPYALSSGDGAQHADEVPYDNATSGLTATNAQEAIDELVGSGEVDADADPTNEFQTLSFDAITNELSLTDGNSITIPSGATDGDADATNEIQHLTLAGTNLEISGGTGVDLAALIPPGGTDDQNASEVPFDNSTSTLTATNTQAAIVELAAGGLVDTDDQDLSLTGTLLQISDGTGVDLAPIIPPGGTDNQNADEVPYDNTTSPLAATNTQAAIDELAGGGLVDTDDQALILTGDILTIEDGAGSVDLSAYKEDVDATSETGILIGDGATVSGLIGTADGQVAKWNAGTSEWEAGTDETGGGGASDAPSGLETITEDGNSGWRLIDRDPVNYGPIGIGAIDLSYSEEPATPFHGATGDYSTTMGIRTRASEFASTAMGLQTTASGNRSTAMGMHSEASGDTSTALGQLTKAIGQSATAMGQETTASEYASTAMGFQSEATGIASTSMGEGTVASGQWSTAMGKGTTASGDYSTAMGDGTIASGFKSTAMGFTSEAKAFSSTAMGFGTETLGYYSTAIGFRTTTGTYASTAIGHYNVGSGGNVLSWDPTDPLFEIGNGEFGARRNALMILKNGNMGIGNITPTTTLDIDGNTRIRELSGAGQRNVVADADGNLIIGAGGGGSSLWTQDGSNINYTSGDVGIGTTDPTAKAHVLHNSNLASPQLRLEESSNDYSRLEFKNESNGYWHIAGRGGDTGDVSRLNFYHHNGTSGRDYMTIAGSGNVGVGTTAPSAKLDVAGDIKTSGEVHGPTTGSANMIPIAYGQISFPGDIDSGSGNFSIEHPTTGAYDIRIPDSGSSNDWVVSVTRHSSSPGHISVISFISGLRVNTYNLSGGLTDDRFSFVIYKP